MSDPRADLGRAGRTHSEALSRELEQRLFESIDYYDGTPQHVLDVGCGSGHGAARLKQRWRGAQVIALDTTLPTLRRMRPNAGWWKPIARVCADALALPFADHGVDVVHANLCLPGYCAPQDLFREFARVLKPGGFLVASGLGPDTLVELRAACARAGADDPFTPFPDMHEVGDAALAAGLKDPVLDTDHLTLHYKDVRALLADVGSLGIVGSDAGPPAAPRVQAIADAYAVHQRDGPISATFEVVTLHAWGFPEGALPLYGGRETRFEVISRREPRTRR